MAKVRVDVMKRLREARGWSQEQLASKMGFHAKTLSNIENGKNCLLSTIASIATALGVQPAELIEGHEPDPPASGPAEKRVLMTLTLSIPFEDFEETEGIDRLSAFLMAVINGKNAIAIPDAVRGSVKLTLLVDEEDAPRLIQAFADHKLDSIQASELGIPRKVALLLIAAIVAQGSVNPIVLPVLPFAAIMLVMKRFQNAGLEVSFADDDLINLKWNKDAATSSGDNTPTLTSFSPSSIRNAIEIVTPENLLPTFPCSITLRLEPEDKGGDNSAVLGARLESLLLDRTSLGSNVNRVDTTPEWSGQLALTLTSVEDLRAMSEVVLTEFLGQPINLAVYQKRSGSFLGSKFTMDGTFTVTLSTSVWESVAKELAEAAKLLH